MIRYNQQIGHVAWVRDASGLSYLREDVDNSPCRGTLRPSDSEVGSVHMANWPEDGDRMAETKRDEARERRISDEIVVDAYGEEEQALGWYYYLDVHLGFPFKARCISERRISPLKHGEVVAVAGMAPEDDCMHEMFVEVRWRGRTFAIPLSQLKGVSVDEETREAIEDWQYWVARGYQF